MEKVRPMRITDPNSHEEYVLEFSRESVKFAEQRGFNIMNYKEQIETGVSNLFYYAFRKNHKTVARNKTDELLDELGGLLPEEVARLEELFVAAVSSLNMEGERKNSRLTVEL